MKNSIIISVIVGILMLVAGYFIGMNFPLSGGKTMSVGSTPPKMENVVDTFSYYYGFNVGQYIAKDLDQLKLKEDFPTEKFLNGMNIGINGKGDEIDQASLQTFMQDFFAKKQTEIQSQSDEQGQKNIGEGKAFLEKNKSEAGVIITTSGLQYQVLSKGDGASPKETDTVTVHYKGTLLDGTTFDSSIDRGEPASFVVNEVIPGWTEALLLMKKGDKWKLFIPSDLAYGPQQRSEQITANSTLIFEVELLGIKSAK